MSPISMQIFPRRDGMDVFLYTLLIMNEANPYFVKKCNFNQIVKNSNLVCRINKKKIVNTFFNQRTIWQKQWQWQKTTSPTKRIHTRQ
uniref:Uncharacterized protein n=1 Tax=Anguilla anguilla TaxID=7936 RepID=A0A0E9VAL7_ANGAN